MHWSIIPTPCIEALISPISSPVGGHGLAHERCPIPTCCEWDGRGQSKGSQYALLRCLIMQRATSEQQQHRCSGMHSGRNKQLCFISEHQLATAIKPSRGLQHTASYVGGCRTHSLQAAGSGRTHTFSTPLSVQWAHTINSRHLHVEVPMVEVTQSYIPAVLC